MENFRWHGMKSCCILLFVLFVSGCKQNSNPGLTIEHKQLFDSIPSASGIAIKGTTAFIISDDGTGIYTIDLTNYRQTKIQLSGLPFNVYREDKSIKHDFEAACFAKWQNKEYLVAIGSGSGGARDSMLMMNTGNYADQKIYSLEKFYKQILSTTTIDSSQLNIEGLTIAGDSIVFLNRGNNLLITCSAGTFFSFILNEQDSLFPVTCRKVQLPFIGQHEARFSGICTVDERHLLFCASVEDTPDWTQDGPVLGSFFGLYSLKNNKVIETYLLQDEEKKPLKEKIESVDIVQRLKSDLFFLATADNDNGTSKLFRIKLSGVKWQ